MKNDIICDVMRDRDIEIMFRPRNLDYLFILEREIERDILETAASVNEMMMMTMWMILYIIHV